MTYNEITNRINELKTIIDNARTEREELIVKLGEKLADTGDDANAEFRVIIDDFITECKKNVEYFNSDKTLLPVVDYIYHLGGIYSLKTFNGFMKALSDKDKNSDHEVLKEHSECIEAMLKFILIVGRSCIKGLCSASIFKFEKWNSKSEMIIDIQNAVRKADDIPLLSSSLGAAGINVNSANLMRALAAVNAIYL